MDKTTVTISSILFMAFSGMLVLERILFYFVLHLRNSNCSGCCQVSMDSEEHNQEIWDNKKTNVPDRSYEFIKNLLFFGYETLKEIRKPKGPWVLVTIDLYSRYIDLQYIGNSVTIENIIKHLKITFHKIGKPKILEADHQFNTKLFRDFLNIQGIEPYFFKGQETNKNAVVESNIKTVKNLILKYIYNFGIPSSIQMMLDIVTEEFNNHYHKGIKTTP